MLTHLTIRDFTLIESLELELHQGMTVLSGETGAGKSILLDALGLALGDRADADMVRSAAEKADITASFDLSQNTAALALLRQQDLDNDNECILRRVISRNGRSRAYINGHPCPLQQLRTLGEQLIEIHGQHEHQRLLKKEHHRKLLDAYAGLEGEASEVRQHFKHWHQLDNKLTELRSRSDESSAREQLLRYQVQELDQLAPEPGELALLEQELKQLSQADEILQAGERVRQLTTEADADTCTSLLNYCLQQLGDLQLDNPALNSSIEMLNSALIQIEEASAELGHFLDHIEPNPQRLTEVEERLSLYYQIARKHRVAPETLVELQQQLSRELAELSLSDESLALLEADCVAAEQRFQQSAIRLSGKRSKAAVKLNKAVNAQLAQLGMPAAQFVATLHAIEGRVHGLEDIEFLISTNPGQPAKPLHKIASGGELSRISLAIQVVTAQTSATPVMAFDEVDVGIGGAIAEVVGRLLRDLGETSQVLCVTHQPQVASRGHNHLQVSKEQHRQTTRTRIHRLDAAERVQEVARMLGGIDITQRSLDHAEEMLALG